MEAVIFDMDGVLVDTEPLHLEAVNEVLDRFDVALTPEENAAWLGLDDRRFFEAVTRKHGIEAGAASLAAEREKRVIDLIQGGLVLQPGVTELVVGLKMRGFPMALASSSSRAVVDAVLGEVGLERSFDAVVCADDVEEAKPDPALFLLAAERMDVPPSDCLVIEDAPHGVEAARAAGMAVVAVVTRDNFEADFGAVLRVLNGLDRFDWSLLDDR